MEDFIGLFILLIIIGIILIVYFVRKSIKRKKLQALETKYNELKFKYQTEGLPIVETGNLKLTKGESCHFVGNANACKIKNKIVGYKGGSRGFSIRVMKGVSFRVGNFRGHSVKKNVIEKNNGTIYITSKKIVFSAIQNSSVLNLNEIVGINAYEGLLIIQTNKKEFLFEIEDTFSFLLILECLINKEEASDTEQ